ncbi:hypothetical protein GGR53DRAFT_409545 [Hypoxylon sp. FL1150]|nr:hypothetical protein GGR53DRAFT_409545 [Hypoxylon sp. FL1150]
MRSFAPTFVTVAVVWSLGMAAMKYDDHNRILYPTKSLTFNSYDTIEVSYLSNLTSPILYTWCRVGGLVKAERADYPDGNNASALIQLDFEADTDLVACWFNMRENEEGSASATDSESFNFNSTVAEKKTFSSDSATSSSTSSSTSTSTSTLTSTSTSTSTGTGVSTPSPAEASTSASISTPSPSSSASASPSPALSTGAQAGIGVGVGFLGVLIGAAVVFLLNRRRRGKQGDGPVVEDKGRLSDSSHYVSSSAAPSMVTNNSFPNDPRVAYYAELPQRDQFADDITQIPHIPQIPQVPQVSQTPQPAPFVQYALSVGPDNHKFAGMPPLATRHHEMDARPPTPEMP